MNILYSPIFDNINGYKLDYSFVGEKITVTLDGQSDIFDFTSCPDGELDIENIESTLPFRVIERAERTGGVLSIKLIYFINNDSTEEEKNPTWFEV